MFFPLVRILCALSLESLKKCSTLSWCGTFGIQFLRARGCLTNPTNPVRPLSFCFGVIGKTQGLISRNNFVKKNLVCIDHRVNVLARCDSIFPLLRCQAEWNKTCTQLSLSQILLQKPKNYNFGDVQRFCYHSWCDSAVIFFLSNQQQPQCLPQFESILDGHLSRHLPAPARLEIENTT